jgi:hypothetical protein
MNRRAFRVAIALAIVPFGGLRAGAQHVAAGAQLAFATYGEQGTSLRFGGSGPSAQISLGWRRLGLTLGAARFAFDPTAGGSVAESFDMTHVEARLRVRATRLVDVEAGFVDRDIAPEHAAQSVAAIRLGVLATFPLHVDSDVAVRASYLGGSKFSGGGSAPFGVEIGLGVGYAPWKRWLTLTGDLEFQRFDRRIDAVDGRISAPIQSTVARLGVLLSR